MEVDRFTKSLVGTPCPVCHSVMFTEGEWRSYQRVRVWIWGVKILRAVFFWMTPKTYSVRVTSKSSEVREK